MIREYIEMINKATLGSPIFYLTKNIERSFGLENLLRHFYIITGQNSYTIRLLEERGIEVMLTQPELSSSLQLIKDSKVQEYITKNTRNKAHLMYFKPSRALEVASGDNIVLNPDARIAGKIENKITQYQLLQEGGFGDNLPKAILKRISEVDFDSLVKELGSSFVVQFDVGHSGNSTFFIHSKEEFDTFKNEYFRTNMMMKFVQTCAFHFITTNGVATINGTYVGGLCNQMTGLQELGALRGETCGNNWYQLGVTDQIREEAVALTKLLGEYFYTLGYRGFFGVDFSITGEELYILEINARQTASIQDFTKLQLENEEIPLAVINLLELLQIPFSIDIEQYNKNNAQPIDASALIVRNHAKPFQVLESYGGLYDIESVTKKEDAYAIDEIYSTSRALILEAIEGRMIGQGDDFLKISVRGNVLKDMEHIDDNILNIIATIQAKTKTIDTA